MEKPQTTIKNGFFLGIGFMLAQAAATAIGAVLLALVGILVK